jgi:hypothetical protein
MMSRFLQTLAALALAGVLAGCQGDLRHHVKTAGGIGGGPILSVGGAGPDGGIGGGPILSAGPP